MELEFKRDFEDARRRWAAFWRGESSRPLVSLVVPREGVQPFDKPPYMAGMDGNFGPVVDRILRWAETHEFLGEAIPFHYVTFGPDHFSALLGARMEVNPDSPDTSWIVPFVEDWDDAEIAFQPRCFWWETTVQFIRALRARGDGRVLVCPPTLVANLDALAAIRGAERLLVDLVTCPDKVKRALEAVSRAYDDILDALCDEAGVAAYGGINRHGMYSPGRINVPQCDFSCMIGPEMFRQFAVPSLRREAEALDAVEYHLDGPGALRHLEAVCAIERIGVIQWVPGAGAPAQRDWSDLYRRIDALGKGQIRGAAPDDVKRLWDEYESRRLFLNVRASSRREAEKLLAELDLL